MTGVQTCALPISSVDTEWTLLTNTVAVKKKAWDAAWAIVSTGNFLPSDDANKNECRKSYESGNADDPEDTSLRLFIARYIRFWPSVTKEQKVAMRLLPPDLTKSPAPEVGATNILREVIGSIVQSSRLMHRCKIVTPNVTYRGLGEGIACIDVFMALVAADSKESPSIKEYVWVGNTNGGIYTQIFEIEQLDMIAYYVARKVLKGSPKKFGPFCEPWKGRVI